jgi:hypothetical protein
MGGRIIGFSWTQNKIDKRKAVSNPTTQLANPAECWRIGANEEEHSDSRAPTHPTQPAKLGIRFTKSSSDEIDRSGPGCMAYLQCRGRGEGPAAGERRRVPTVVVGGDEGCCSRAARGDNGGQHSRERALLCSSPTTKNFGRVAHGPAGPLRSLRITLACSVGSQMGLLELSLSLRSLGLPFHVRRNIIIIIILLGKNSRSKNNV